MQHRLISALVVISTLFLGNLAAAADNAQVIGSWNMELDFQGQPFSLDLVISESDGALAGTLGASEFGVSPLQKSPSTGKPCSLKHPTNKVALYRLP